jgi:hypothetical protein
MDTETFRREGVGIKTGYTEDVQCRQPERTLLHEMVRENIETLLACAAHEPRAHLSAPVFGMDDQVVDPAPAAIEAGGLVPGRRVGTRQAPEPSGCPLLL